MPELQLHDAQPAKRGPAQQKCWIAVASAEHVRIGRREGFMQVCHGKGAPLRRITPGDWIAYYSPTETFGGRDRLRAFTAIGVVKPGAPYQAHMGGGFRPFRRDVRWIAAAETPIHPLLADLSFSADNRNWGYQLRFGLFEVERRDMRRIARAMGASAIPVDALSVRPAA